MYVNGCYFLTMSKQILILNKKIYIKLPSFVFALNLYV